MKVSDIINDFIRKYKYQSYLEVGVHGGATWNHISLDRQQKFSIDPKPVNFTPTFLGTSDDFFAQNKVTFDIFFIDGLHVVDQVDRDIANCLACMNEGGTIIVHDCNPESESVAGDTPLPAGVWNGSVWKSIAKLRCTNPNLSISVVNTDFGCGIIRRGTQTLYTKEPLHVCLNWEYFNRNKVELLNLISTSDYQKLYP